MAIVTNNAITTGFQGTFGNELVFKHLRGKTFVMAPARKPAEKKESEAQRSTRSNFREAAQWAQHILLDPQKKAYYQQRARKLKLTNAYTAAITDFMRKPKVLKAEVRGTVVCSISKPGFALPEVRVINTPSVPVKIWQSGDRWIVQYKPIKDALLPALAITDNIERVTIST